MRIIYKEETMPVPLCDHETMVITYSGLWHFTGTRLMGATA